MAGRVVRWALYAAGGLAALLLLAAGGLWAAGLRQDAGVLRAQTEVALPAATVWPWLQEPAKLKSWVGWLVDVRHPEPGRTGVGSREVWVMEDRNNGNQLMEIDATVSHYEPPRRLVLRNAVAGMFHGQHSYVLTDMGNGRTRVEMEGRYHFEDRLARLLEPVITRAAQDKAVEDLARLKAQVEGR